MCTTALPYPHNHFSRRSYLSDFGNVNTEIFVLLLMFCPASLHGATKLSGHLLFRHISLSDVRELNMVPIVPFLMLEEGKLDDYLQMESVLNSGVI